MLECADPATCQRLAAAQEAVVVQAITITVALIGLYYLFRFAVFGPRVD